MGDDARMIGDTTMFTVQINLDGQWVATDCTGEKAKCDAEARSWLMFYASDEIRVVSA